MTVTKIKVARIYLRVSTAEQDLGVVFRSRLHYPTGWAMSCAADFRTNHGGSAMHKGQREQEMLRSLLHKRQSQPRTFVSTATERKVRLGADFGCAPNPGKIVR